MNIKDTKHYYLSPSGGEKNNSYFNSNITFALSGIIKDDPTILYNTLSIVHCEIPYSFYVINEYNNILGLSTGDINIDYGNYNANSLMKFINSKLPTNMILSFNTSNGKFTLTYNQSFLITENTTIYNILGLEKQAYSSSSNIINFPYPCNTLGTKNIYIKSNFMLSNYNSLTQDYVTIATIPVNVEPFGIILYNNFSNITHKINNKIIDSINIELFDDNNNLIDFNNIEWTITLETNSFTNLNITNNNLTQYLNN